MSNPIPGVAYTRIHPSLDWVAPGRPSLTAQPPPPPNTDIIVGSTKPEAFNVGTGIVRPAPTQVADGNDGTWANGILTITKDLRDRIVPGCVKIGAGGLTIENCLIQTNPAYPPTGTRYVIDTGGGFPGVTAIRYNEISPLTQSQYFNAIGPRNVVAEYNDISHVTDGFVASQRNSIVDVNMMIRANYVHDFLFYAPDPGHDPTPLTTAAGETITGPWAGQPWNHADGLQVEQAGTSGITLIGNNIVATWANDEISTLPLPNAIKELSCLMLNAGADLVIEDNWFDGGEYAINNGNPAVTGSMRRNRFGRRMAHTGTADGTYFALMLSAPGLLSYDGTADQNIWEDTGLLVARRGS